MKNFSTYLNKKLSFYKKALFFLSLFILICPTLIFASLDYTPMENIPGFGSSGDFGTFISNFYKFGIWTVGICALIMIVIGGYFYAASGGNNATMQKAKGFITDAIIGLILALLAYLILYIINPELIKIKTQAPAYSGTTPTAPKKTVGGTGSGLCKPTTKGPCSVENMKKTCFGEANAEKASAICVQESSNNVNAMSRVEKNGKIRGMCHAAGDLNTKTQSYAVGLFQINLTCYCPEAFSSSSGKETCANDSCIISKPAVYNDCVTKYTDITNNTNKACELLNTSKGWNHWEANQRSCHF